MTHALRPLRQRGALSVAVSLAVAGAAAGAVLGWQVQAWRWRAADAERLELEREARQALERRADAAAQQLEDAREGLRARQRVITREVERVVESPVYRDVCLDADGMRLVAQAAGTAASASQPAPAVPTPGASP